MVLSFFDNIPSHNLTFKQIRHYRSFTAKEEPTYVKQCCYKCLDNANSIIPAEKIKVDNEEKKLKTLNYFNNTIDISTKDRVRR